MSYSKQTWVDGLAGGTPLSAARLNVMETGIDSAHDLIAAADGISLTTGTLAAMPATGTGSLEFYFASDDAGGTLHADLTSGEKYAQMGRRGELSSASLDTPFTTTATGSFVDATGLNLTLATRNRPVYLEVTVPSFQNGAVDTISTALVRANDGAVLALGVTSSPGSNSYGPGVVLRYRLPANSASQTYKVQVRKLQAGSLVVQSPAHFTAVEQ